MNNDYDKDKLQFNKLYELLGEEVNAIYNTKKDDEIFTNKPTNANNYLNNYVIPGVKPTNSNIEKEIINNINNDIFVNNEKIFDDIVNDQPLHNNEINLININEIVPTKIDSNIDSNYENKHTKNDIVLNKTTIDGKNIIDDIDNIDYGKATIREFFSNRKIVSIILMLAFICVCVVVIKIFYFD